MALWLGLWMALALSGCGYAPAKRLLPEEAASLGIKPVLNRTFEGELDTLLQRELRHKTLRMAHAELADPEFSDLSLEVALDSFTATRYRDLVTTTYSFSYNLTGQMTLTDDRKNRVLIDHEPVAATVSLTFDGVTLETPAVRGRGVSEAAGALATQIMNRIMVHF